MKNAKKLLSVLLAVLMTLTVCAPVLAAANKWDKIINNGETVIEITPDALEEGTDYTLPSGSILDADKPNPNDVFYGWSVKIGTADPTLYVWNGTDFMVGTTAKNKIAGADITADVTLTAVWGYEVTYDVNGGTAGTSGEHDPVIVPKTAFDFTLPVAPTPPTTPSGLVFAYWEIGIDKYAAESTVTDMVFAGPTTIEAIYEKSVLVDFLPGDGNGTANNDIRVPAVYFLPTLAEANLLDTTGTDIGPKTGKTFAGWKIGTSDTIYAPGDLVSMTDGDEITALWKNDSNTITINGANNDHKFNAYQIFTGDVIGDKLTNIQWGTGIKTDSTSLTGLAADLKALVEATDWYGTLSTTTTPKKADVDAILTALSGTSTAAAFAEVLNLLEEHGDADDFEELGNKLVNYTSTTVFASSSENAAPYTIDELPDGYYFVVDTFDTTHSDTDDFISDYILRVVTDVIVNVKGSKPSVDKEVKEAGGDYEDTTEQDPMGVKIGDTLNYKIEGTLPSNYADYKEYGVVFTDTMDAALTLKTDTIKVYIHNGTAFKQVSADDVIIDTTTTPGTMVVTIKNLKAETPDTTHDGTYDEYYGAHNNGVIKIEYDCVVNEKASLDTDGVQNSVKMKFTNDPNQVSTGDPTTGGETPPDVVYVDPVSFKIVKTDAATDALLTGAEFKLYSKEACAATDEIKLVGCYIDSGVEKVVNPAVAAEVDLIEYYRVATADEITAASNLIDILVLKKSAVKIDGLDADLLYYLKETVAPAGYNLLTLPVEIQPNKSTDTSAASINADGEYEGASGTIYNIKNNSGMELPATGGMGTVIFVAVGAVVFMATMLVLVTKKRMYNEG